MTDLKFSEKTILYWWNQHKDEKGFSLFLWWDHGEILPSLCSHMRLQEPLTVQQLRPWEGQARSYRGIGAIAGPLPPTCLPSPPGPGRSRCGLSQFTHHWQKKPAASCWTAAAHREKSICCIAGIRGLENIGLLPLCCVFSAIISSERRPGFLHLSLWGGGPAQQKSGGCLKPCMRHCDHFSPFILKEAMYLWLNLAQHF